MANAISGALSSLRYGWETTYKTEATTIDKIFGWAQKPVITRKNSLTEGAGVGSRNVQKLVQGLFEGSASIEWIVANGYFLRFVLGAAPTDAGSGPYTHSYAESTTLSSGTVEFQRPTDTAHISRLAGFKCSDFTLSAQVGQPIIGKMNGLFAQEKTYTTTSNTASETEDEFHFGQASLTVGSAYADIQSLDFTIANSTKLLGGLGSVTPTQGIGHLRKYGLKVRIPVESVAELTDTLGATSGVTGATNKATGTLTITNGGAGTALRSIAVNLANLKIDDYNETATAEDVLMADVTFKGLSCSSIVYTNNTAAAP